MLRPCQRSVRVEESSQVGEARRLAGRVCAEAGVSEGVAGRVAIITTELATNLVMHAGGGEILLQQLGTAASPIIDILAIDSGPGMKDPDRCMDDGFSTAGTPGNGLGAVRRQSDTFDVYSRPGSGTVVVSQVGTSPEPVAVGAVCIPHPAEQVCGDGWLTREVAGKYLIMVVDGLGHGRNAAHAADVALGSFAEAAVPSPAAILTLAHERMTSTRGGAVAVAELDMRTSSMRYGAIGNIAGALVTDGESHGLYSANGTVGAQIRAIKELDYACSRGSILILHSDGLTTRWRLTDYPGLARRHPSVIAGVLYRDFRRGRDDVTVLVARARERH